MERRKASIVLEDMNYYKDQVNLITNFVIHKEGNKIDEHVSHLLKMELQSMENHYDCQGLS